MRDLNDDGSLSTNATYQQRELTEAYMLEQPKKPTLIPSPSARRQRASAGASKSVQGPYTIVAGLQNLHVRLYIVSTASGTRAKRGVLGIEGIPATVDKPRTS
jgi:hypothetical protein